jgi:hypothetical protein
MNSLTDDQIVASNKKRVRRNALKPNSAECDALREFSVFHTLERKMALNGEVDEEKNKETYKELTAREKRQQVRDKRQRVSDTTERIEIPPPETEMTMSVGAASANQADDASILAESTEKSDTA